MNFISIAEKINFQKNKNIILWTSFFISCCFLSYIIFHPTEIDAKQEEIKKLVATVGTLTILPSEVPVVATITDLKKLKGQVFFKNAKVGDKVLIYMRAEKAILYSPALNKIVDVTLLNNLYGQSKAQ